MSDYRPKMRFNAPHIFSKMHPWYTKPTPWANRTHWPWYMPLWCIWLLKLLLRHRWALNLPLELLNIKLYILWPDLLQWDRLLHWWPLWSWPNVLWYKLLLWHSTNTCHPLRLTLHIPKLPLITITSISITIIIIPLKIFKSLIITISLNSRSLPKWDGRILKTRLLWSKG
ncbi:hypothetical protein HanIR_Chr15g0786601 [Helianthus annuus]|nr:hypothetical protein HanIR_Chr15g0786601 [Helianthus annuus]